MSGRQYAYTHSFTIATCAAAKTVITVQLLRNRSQIGIKSWTLTTTAPRKTPSPTSTATPKPISTPAPTSTPTPSSNPAIHTTPDAPTDVRGHWDVNLAPGKYSGSYTYYGYQTRLIGSVSSNTFDYEGVTYTVTFFKWDQSADEITFKLDKCLKPSAFSGLRVGDLTFDEIDDDAYTDSQCESNSGRDQRFDFDVSTNPLPTGGAVRVTLLLKLPDPFVITADPAFPSSGEYVNLSVPDYGTSYQWQQWSGGEWTNLGSASTRESKSVSFSTQGTRKFRVVANPGTTSSLESPAIHVTWDIWNVGLALMTHISSAVATSTDYKTVQTALLTCVNSGRTVTSAYASFDDVLADYTGTTKTRMESGGACHTQSESMFSAYQRLTESALDTHSTSTSEYFLFLESDEGKDLTSDLGDADELKNLAIYASADLPGQGALETPLYESRGASESSSTPRPGEIPSMGRGIDCLPAGVDGSRLSTRNKLNVLNCLVFSTDHSFWVNQASFAVPTSERLRNHPRYRNWLESDDWECTGPGAFEGPVPACWKHDFAFNGLQRFEGEAGEDSWGDELDITWNPRNKALADLKFKADILKYGCQAYPLTSVPQCAASGSALGRAGLAASFHSGVAEFNDKGWPVTSRDLQGFSTDVADLPGQDDLIDGLRFQRCSEPIFPAISDVGVVPSGDTVTLSWNFHAGCTAELSDVEFNATWYIKPPVLLYFAPVEDHTVGICTTTSNRVSCAYDFSRWQSGAVI